MDQNDHPGPEPGAPPAGSSALAWLRRPLARAAIAASLAIGGGLGTFAIAHAASTAASASPAPSTSPSPGTSTPNCPNM